MLPLETAELGLLVPGLQAAVVCALAESYAGDGAAAPALFTSLRALGTAAWGMLAERCDRVGRILARDPVGVYPAMEEATRAYYRQTVARLARRTGRAEIDIAEDVLARAQSSDGARRHVGWFLLREVLGAPEKRGDGAWYIAAVVVGTLFLSLLLGFATKSVSGAVLLLIPVSEVVKGLLDAVLLRVTKPRFVPRLALRRGIPPEGRTLCVIAALLTSPDDAHALGARLEEYYLCNRDAGENLTFGLLADLPEADHAHAPVDPAILRAACAEIEALNTRWGSRFYLFTRKRVPTPDGKWSAWERKRGALLELARLVLDRPGALHCAAGDAAGLSGTVYLLTLDADTRLTPARRARSWARCCTRSTVPWWTHSAAWSRAAMACCTRAWPQSWKARMPPTGRACSPGPAAPTPTAARAGSCIWTALTAAASRARASSTRARCSTAAAAGSSRKGAC